MSGSSLLACLLALWCGGAPAASFTFTYSYDGSAPSLEAGDTPNGTALVPGDDFTVILAATPGSSFQVMSDINRGFPLTYLVSDSATRTATISTEFSFLGGTVLTIERNSFAQNFVHVGAQNWSLPSGLEFDRVSLSWSFESIAPGGAPTTIQGNAFNFAPFYNASELAFAPASTVPLPPALPLMLAGIAGLVALRRRR